MNRSLALLAAVTMLGCACSSGSSDGNASSAAPTPSQQPVSTDIQNTVPTSRGADEPLPPSTSPYEALGAETGLLDAPFAKDVDAMVKRRLIRAGVVYSRTHYFIDKGVQRGINYESLKLFEDEVNRRLKLKIGVSKVHVVIVPLLRDQLFPALREGKVDLISAALTITPERRKLAAFSTPTRTGVSELVVTAKDVAPVGSPDDLSGREVYVRRSSSYYGSLTQLNESLQRRNKPAVIITEAPEPFEDDDILEMVNAGLVDCTVVDDYLAEFWSEVFPNVRLNTTAVVRTDGEIAVAVRKDNPRLLQAVNTWIKRYGPHTAFGNTIERRYLQSMAYVKNAAAESERRKFRETIKLFQKYGRTYNVNYLLMAAQGYQESGLDQAAKSPVGAIGVMQLMPATGRDLRVGDITKLEPNIHGGVKYFRFLMDHFFKDEPMDDLNRELLTFASYNAGSGRIRQLRAETARRGLNPNIWFGNVERVVSERIGRETVQYVNNIYKYYVAYRLATERDSARARAKQTITP